MCGQETLRYHCIVYHLNRVASEDDVIPLAYPITTSTGEVITEIPVAAGQVVMPNIAVYNRYDRPECELIQFTHDLSAVCQRSGVLMHTNGILRASSTASWTPRFKWACTPICRRFPLFGMNLFAEFVSFLGSPFVSLTTHTFVLRLIFSTSGIAGGVRGCIGCVYLHIHPICTDWVLH